MSAPGVRVVIAEAMDEATIAAELAGADVLYGLANAARGCAALDVFGREPLDAEAGSLRRNVPNLILMPHIAGVTVESDVRASAVTAAAVRRRLAGS